MGRNLVETVMGALVLVIAGFFLAFAYKSASLQAVEGYEISARFNSVEGLDRGSDVRVGGVKIGSVTGQSLDPVTYMAIITMTIDPGLKLPVDTRASVSAEGLLGETYVRLEPGHADEILEPGGMITDTKDVVALEQLLGKFIFLLIEEEE